MYSAALATSPSAATVERPVSITCVTPRSRGFAGRAGSEVEPPDASTTTITTIRTTAAATPIATAGTRWRSASKRPRVAGAPPPRRPKCSSRVHGGRPAAGREVTAVAAAVDGRTVVAGPGAAVAPGGAGATGGARA